MLEDIKANIEKLIALYESEKVENGRLRARLSESEIAVETCRKQIIELEEQIETQRLRQAFTAQGAVPTEAKEKLDRMIKEIDKCISYLEK
jgi:phage shock protein A